MKDIKIILFVCSGNTCRSPMAKALLQHKLQAMGRPDDYIIESAATGSPTLSDASVGAREAIKRLCREDLLAVHKAKSLFPSLIEEAGLILTATGSHKTGLPPNKTWTLKEFAGGTGDISDPFGGDLNTYLETARELSSVIDKIIPKL